MKLYAFVLLLSCVFASSDALPERNFERILSDSMLAALEKLRDLIYNGNETLGIPVLDPLQHPGFSVNMDSSLLSGNLKVENIALTGIGAFDVSNVDITMIPMAVKFDGAFPLTTLHIDTYSLLGKLLNTLPIYGNGIAHFEIGKFTFSGVAKVSVGISGVTLRDLQLELGMGSFESQTTGMLGGGDIDDLINAILADFVPDLFNNNSDLVNDLVGDIVLNSLNKVLDGMSLSDLIDLITGGGSM